MRKLLLPLFLILLLLPAGGVTADSDPGKIEGEIRRMADEVADIAGKQRGFLDRVLFLKRRIRLDEAQLRRVINLSHSTREKLAATEREIVAITRQEENVSAYLAERMRQQYALGILQQYRVYFAIDSTQDLRSAGVYLQMLARKDSIKLAELRSLHLKREKSRTTLDTLNGKLEKQALVIAEEKRSLGKEQRALTRTLNDLARKKATAQKALKETIAAARKMDTYIKDLAFRSRVNIYSNNIEEKRGKLKFPCKGRVTRGFGEYTNPRFGTRIPHPGIDISADLGAPVHAVFDGIVEYADWLNGYGYTVILRHPGGYFTTYAHLDRVLVHRDDTAKTGETIGTVGDDPSTSTTSLYFEIRQGGKAVSPLQWFIRSAK